MQTVFMLKDNNHFNNTLNNIATSNKENVSEKVAKGIGNEVKSKNATGVVSVGSVGQKAADKVQLMAMVNGAGQKDKIRATNTRQRELWPTADHHPGVLRP